MTEAMNTTATIERLIPIVGDLQTVVQAALAEGTAILADCILPSAGCATEDALGDLKTLLYVGRAYGGLGGPGNPGWDVDFLVSENEMSKAVKQYVQLWAYLCRTRVRDYFDGEIPDHTRGGDLPYWQEQLAVAERVCDALGWKVSSISPRGPWA